MLVILASVPVSGAAVGIWFLVGKCVLNGTFAVPAPFSLYLEIVCGCVNVREMVTFLWIENVRRSRVETATSAESG